MRATRCGDRSARGWQDLAPPIRGVVVRFDRADRSQRRELVNDVVLNKLVRGFSAVQLAILALALVLDVWAIVLSIDLMTASIVAGIAGLMIGVLAAGA